MLRYAKVNAIKGTTVFLTGVNPRTAKHVQFAIENGWWKRGKEALKDLEDALSSRIFLKIFVGKHKVDFEPEKPPENREDSYLTFLSYAKESGYNPKFLRELDHYLVTMTSWTNPVKDLGMYLLNATDKLGMVFYARDRITNLSKKTRPPHVEIRYHVVSSIVSCKGCLDALAAIVNEVYGVGHRKGKIDLATIRSDLLHHIEKNNNKLWRLLKDHEKWINKMTTYRDFVIHKIMLSTPPVGSQDDVAKPLKVRVPSKPLSINTREEEQKKVSWIDAGEFCEAMIERLQSIMEIVCVDLLRLIESKTYFPI